jgi:phosphate starvation-inducible membrane PsiE
VLNGYSSEKLMLNGASRVCSMLSLVLCPKHVYFASLTLTAEYLRSGWHMPLNKAITIN